MINLLLKLFVKDYKNIENPNVREKYGILGSCIGIFLNVLLSACKFTVGLISNSIAITSDAVNNLSDAGSSIVTLVGFKASSKPADDRHPFGHGRIEYISALVVAFMILFMGIQLIKTSVSKIMSPKAVTFSYPALIVLILSILVKLWMAYFNRTLGKKINSPAMGAVVIDSLNDTIATSASMVALIAAKYTSFPLDGYMGIMVSAFIIFTGIKIVNNTVSTLLGEAPDKEFVDELEKYILSYDGIVGVHDLIINNYGPKSSIASVHAEVPADSNIITAHDTIDKIERDILKKYNMVMVIHTDPIVIDDERINELRLVTKQIVSDIDNNLSIHDFRVVDGPTHTNLIFDLLVPHRYKIKKDDLIDMVSSKLKEINENYFAVITVECGYLS